jgi:serine/threonine protein kinase
MNQAMPEQFGKYELLKRLAFGGMAEIFLARLRGEAGFSKQLVVKRILPQFGEDAHFVKMFIDEAVLAAHINHPNVVQIYDFGSTDE